MNIQRRTIVFFSIVTIAVAGPMSVHAYQIDTHAFLADETILFYNTHFNEKVPEDFRAFLIDGARKEDESPRWMNHFYDPVKKRGLSHDPAIDPVAVVGSWQMSKEWAEDRDNQNKPTYKIPTAIASILTALQRWKISEITSKTDFTWQEAIRHYVNEDKEKAFFTLGHILHLVQDASVPAHTRNDAHAEGDPYEMFSGKYTLSTPDDDLKIRLLNKKPEAQETLGLQFEKLATYSNNNFYSKNTIGTGKGFLKPEFEESNLIFIEGLYYPLKSVENNSYYLVGEKSLNKFLRSRSNFELNDVVNRSYWSLLSTKSIQHGAGVIDLFFKEVEKAKNDPNFKREEEKSFLGNLVSAIKFGVQEIGSAVGSVFEKKGNSIGEIAQDPPPASEYDDQEELVFSEETTSEIHEDDVVAPDTVLVEEFEDITEEEEKKIEDEPEEIDEKIQEKQKESDVVFCLFNQNRITKEKTIIINEVAWMGTEKGHTKEWFELKNISKRDISLGGWQILSHDNEIKISIPVDTILKPDTFVLFERGSDDTVPNEIADVLYSGNLSNDGTKKTEGLRVFDDSCVLHDEVLATPWWPAGDNSEKRTMERDKNGIGWHSSSVFGGTPKKENSEKYVSSVSGGGSSPNSPRYFSVIINEIFYDALGSDVGKEWIEIKNEDSTTVNFENWKLFEGGTNHGLSLAQGSFSVPSGSFAVIADDASAFLSEYPSFSGNLFDSAFSLSNDGETIILKNETLIIDSVSYASSTGARGDGNSLQKIGGVWQAATPTPGNENTLPNQPPEVSFSLTPSEPIAGEFVYLESSSSDSDGIISNLSWNFGDGMATSGTSSIVTHMYASEGLYLVSLSATDNGGATASSSQSFYVASSSATTSPVTHVVISEILFDAEGSDEGKEFIELYNPTDTDIDLTAWSLAYFVGNSTTSVSIATVGSSAGDGLNIPAKGFFLVGTNSYDSSNFGGLEADAVRSRSLPNGSDWISIALSDASGSEIDRVRYTNQSIQQEGRSIERKTVAQNTCTSARGNYEYFGNTCDRGSDGDFDERIAPKPQNSLNLKEPRGRLSLPTTISGETSIGTFTKNTMTINFLWAESTSTDPVGEIVYSIFDVSTGRVEMARTTSTTSSVAITEVGRTYSFEIYAEDAEGYRSEINEFNVSAPSFFTRVHAYPDPRTSDGTYLIDMYWNEFPFIPQNKGGTGWQALVFYRNRAANDGNTLIPSSDGFVVPDQNGILLTRHESCATDIVGADQDIFLIPLGAEWCSAEGGGLYPRAFNWSRLEDNHALIKIDPLNDGDYISVGYYDKNGSGHFELVAIDTTEWYSQVERPTQNTPELSGDIEVSFDIDQSQITLTLPMASDDDSIDSELVYEINFSPNATSTLDDVLWNATTTASEYIKSVAPGDAFLIGVRAKDDFGNLSGVATTTWAYPSIQFPIVQMNMDGWSSPFGTVMFSANEADTASFQSFAPESDFSFDAVVMRVQQNTVSDETTLRLSVLGSVGTSTPDFTNVIRETTLGGLVNPPSDEEKTFSFASPISVTAGSTYWLVLDVASYFMPQGYTRNIWTNAVVSDGDAYLNGISGSGHYRGQNASCSDTVVCDFVPNSGVDWYMKIGTRE